jgi:hypothetical protein
VKEGKPMVAFLFLDLAMFFWLFSMDRNIFHTGERSYVGSSREWIEFVA